MGGQGPNIEQFEAYFQRADVDRDGRISGSEAVNFLQASNLPRQVLAQIWNYADQNRSGFLGRPEFYNALKLVTVAQSKRDLTPELVKAALLGPASSKIPAPQMNLAALPASQSNMNRGQSPGQMVRPPTSNQGLGLGGPLSHLSQQSQASRPPLTLSPTPGFQAQPSSSTQGIPGMGSAPISQHPNSFNSLGGTTDGSAGGISLQVTNKSLIPSATLASADSLAAPSVQSKPPQVAALLQTASPVKTDAASLFSQAGKEGSKSPLATGNGFASDSMLGDAFSAKPQPHQNSTPPMYPVGSMPASSAGSWTYSKDQPAAKINFASQPPAIPSQQFQSTGKANQNVPQKSSAFPPAARHSQAPWPRMTQSDVQKYSKVFVQVDTDKDGKITGEQARNLFLSWRLPREVLKQVWDLSDQDNDSMLSLREFCVALYLMERFREGRPLPAALPASVMVDEAFHVSGQPNAAYGNMPWRPPTPGFQQSQGTKNARLAPSAGVGRPPRPVLVPQPDEPVQQKAKVPELEKHLLDQLSKEEQDSLNKKLEEAKEAEKKVADLDKDIHEARQKIQFYHAKMQELILYKSRCDNRLNEISEKVVADKREADSLAKKYEEKYKQGADVVSKLTLEEATFRDIQEKKMELYRSIVKLEQENADNVKDRATQIQSDLDELVKALNERCRTYGLRGKPTSLVELPFGWQPGIAATAADWDEVWDKLEEEGYTFVKELTLEVQNVVAPPKPKSTVVREKVTYLDDTSTVKSPSKANNKSEIPNPGEKISDGFVRTPPDSPAGSNAAVSPSKEFYDLQKPKDFNIDGPMPTFDTFDTQSEYGAESVSGDRGFGETGWGSFDTHYDSDAGWDFNPAKEAEHEKHGDGSLFGGDNWGLNPIRTGSKGADMSMPKQGPFFDSVPSTPLSYSASSPHADNLFMKKPSIFADSVPSTPMYNSTASPRRFSEGSEDRTSFDSFSRFDSFNMHDSGPLGSHDSFSRFDSFNMSDNAPLGSREFSRFDSMRSTRDSDFDSNFGSKESFTRFDSFRSTADSDYNFGQAPPRETFSRFDSVRSSRDSDYSQSFPSFDDTSDPFGSSSTFKTSSEAQWNDESMDPFGSGGPFKSSFNAHTSRGDDVADPFGSSGPFKTSFDAQTSRRDDAADSFGSSGQFRTSHETETSRRGYDSWNAF